LKIKIAIGVLIAIIFFLCVGIGVIAGRRFQMSSRLKEFKDKEELSIEFAKFIF
jgi:hypothetical protein